MAQSLSEAATAFEKTLRELGFSGDEAELGERAALLVAAGAVWHHHAEQLLQAKRDVSTISLLFQVPLADYARVPGLEWTRSLDESERASFRADMATALRSVLATGAWELFDNELASWHATAEVNADPELAGALLEDWDPADEIALRRP